MLVTIFLLPLITLMCVLLHLAHNFANITTEYTEVKVTLTSIY